MANYAELDFENRVINIVYLDDNIILDENGNEVDQLGIDYLIKHNGGLKWVRYFENSSEKNKVASIGYFYNEDKSSFVNMSSPYPSWIFDEDSLEWKPPIDKPINEFPDYEWIEEEKRWFSIKEYIFEKYAKKDNYSDIKKVVEFFDLKDNIITPVFKTDNYIGRVEKVKNYILGHIQFTKWSSSIFGEWKKDYMLLLDSLEFDIYLTKKISDEKTIKRIKSFCRLASDGVFLEEKNKWVIFKRTFKKSKN